MKRVTLTLAALGVLSLAAGQAMAAGVKVRSSRGIPILGHAPASVRSYDVGRSHNSRQHAPGCRCASCRPQGTHHGRSHYQGYQHGQPYYGQPYMRRPIVVYPGMYGMNPYYGYPMPYRGFTYNGRGLSLSYGF